MSSRSFSVGSYTRNIQESADPFNERVRAFKDDSFDSLEDNPENWPKEKVKAAAEMFQRNDQAHINAAEMQKTGTAWTKLNPQYIDNDANAQLMRHQLRSNGVAKATLADFDLAYEQLKESGFLKLDKAELAKQEKDAAKALAEAERAHSVEPSIDDLYSMPLEDLRRLDAVENQKRMERIGNEGGW